MSTTGMTHADEHDKDSANGAARARGADVAPAPGERGPEDLGACLEAILIAAGEPLRSADLARALAVDARRVADELDALRSSYTASGRGFELRHTARGWQFASRVEFRSIVASFAADGQGVRLSQAAMETLAVIAYRQPVTRARVSSIRGVNCDGVVRSLLVRGLVREDGVDGESRAALLATADLFLEKMGLESLDQLPSLAPFLPEAGEIIEESGEAL